jgi:hypothetical protein
MAHPLGAQDRGAASNGHPGVMIWRGPRPAHLRGAPFSVTGSLWRSFGGIEWIEAGVELVAVGNAVGVSVGIERIGAEH